LRSVQTSVCPAGSGCVQINDAGTTVSSAVILTAGSSVTSLIGTERLSNETLCPQIWLQKILWDSPYRHKLGLFIFCSKSLWPPFYSP